jgi:ABC-2 type transport system permease protein
MAQRIFSIARNTFTESIRQPIYMVMLGLVIFGLIISLFLSAYTFDNDDKILIELCLSTIFLGGLLLAALVATGVLSREVENKTVLTVISKPVGRPAFIVGKYLGVVAAVALAFWIWSIVTLMLVRHEVMSTARDKVDMPVFIFGF